MRGIGQRLGEDDEFDKNRELGAREQNSGKVGNWICPGGISSKFHRPTLATSCRFIPCWLELESTHGWVKNLPPSISGKQLRGTPLLCLFSVAKSESVVIL